MAQGETVNVGRRSLLAAVAGAFAALVGHAVTAPAQALAADHDPVKIGETNLGNTITVLHSGSSDGFAAESAAGDGLVGVSTTPNKSGLYARSTNATGYGVYARNLATGNWGYAGGFSDAVAGHSTVSAHSGVYGETQHSGGYGVVGRNLSDSDWGYLGGPEGGVRGETAAAGHAGVTGIGSSGQAAGILGRNTTYDTLVAVWASAPQDRFGLAVTGKAYFARSGVVSVAAGKRTAKVPSIGISPASYVLATMQYPRSGVYIQAAVPNVDTDSITIYLNKAVTAATNVAWFVLDGDIA